MIGLNYVNDKKSLGEWFNWIFHAHLVQTSIFTEAFHQWAVENYQIACYYVFSLEIEQSKLENITNNCNAYSE